MSRAMKLCLCRKGWVSDMKVPSCCMEEGRVGLGSGGWWYSLLGHQSLRLQRLFANLRCKRVELNGYEPCNLRDRAITNMMLDDLLFLLLVDEYGRWVRGRSG